MTIRNEWSSVLNAASLSLVGVASDFNMSTSNKELYETFQTIFLPTYLHVIIASHFLLVLMIKEVCILY
jgi:hypothetical protein